LVPGSREFETDGKKVVVCVIVCSPSIISPLSSDFPVRFSEVIMKNGINPIAALVIGLLLFVSTACNASPQTAPVSVAALTLSQSNLSAKVVAASWTSLGPGGGGAFNSPCITGNTWLVGSDLGGAYVSFNKGVSWRALGASYGLGETHVASSACLADGRAVIGSGNGIYLMQANGGLRRVWTGNYISAVLVTANQNILYAAAHTQYNSLAPFLLRSDNAGATWRRTGSINLPANLRVVALRSHPIDTDAVIVISGEGRFKPDSSVPVPQQAWVSIDAGANFYRTDPNFGDVYDMIYSLNPQNLNEMFMTTRPAGATPGKLWKSVDAGGNWTFVSSKTGVFLANRAAPNRLRLIDMDNLNAWTANAGLWESTNAGATWTRTGTVQGWRGGWSNAINVWGVGSSYQGYLQTSTVSDDGQTVLWTDSQFVHASLDGGRTFNHLVSTSPAPGFWRSRGIDNAVPTMVAPSAANPNIAFVSYRDMGLWRTDNAGQSWKYLYAPNITTDWGNGTLGGNSFTVLPDPARQDVVWANLGGDPGTAGNSRLMRSINRGATWTATTGVPATVKNISGLSLNPLSSSTNRTLYVVADGRVYRSLNDGQAWAAVFTTCSGCQFTWVINSTIFAGGSRGLYRSSNATAWARVNLSTPAWPTWWNPADPLLFWANEFVGISDLTISPNGNLWAAVTGAGFYRSNDNGTSWTLVKADRFARSVSIQGNLILTGSSSSFNSGGYDVASRGVQQSLDNGLTWTAQNPGLAFPFATQVRINPNGGAWWVLSPGQGVLKR
jgi:hypothetical protein